MKVIELLNKIANGEQPQKIAYRDRAYEWGYDTYTSLPETSPEVQMSASLFSHYRIEYCLNDEVEIIEEEKKIPEPQKDILKVDDLIPPVDENMYKIWTQTIKNHNKINEICDYLKSKGE